MWLRAAGLAVSLLVALPGHADDTHKASPADDPDPSFLEFLGGVDGLAEVTPDYIAQASAMRGAVPPPTAPKPAPPPPPPPNPGAKNND